jgi:D-aminoacyl-tRNA deacylase
MRAVVQRVTESRVSVDGEICGRIGRGLLVLLGIGQEDKEKDAEYLAEKTAHLRIFRDDEEKMNLSLLDIRGEVLVISQFTLFGDCRRGRRPSFTAAAPPEEGKRLYRYFVEQLKGYGLKVEEGIFQAMMMVHLVNDGPVTMLLDSARIF